MSLTKKQKEFGESLLNSLGNITQACDESGCTLKDFNEWIKIDEFREIYDTAIQICDDQAHVSFMNLIDAGDRAATIEYQKLKRQREDIKESDRVKREIMRILVETQETKTACLKEYCQVFKCTKNSADDQYDNVIAEFNLKSPNERLKEKKKLQGNSLSEKFKKGKLSEIEMYSSMLEKALYDSENADYPSERSKARADVISINQRLDEINERKIREAEQDEGNIFDNLDAVLAGVSPSEIKALRNSLIVKEIEHKDVK